MSNPMFVLMRKEMRATVRRPVYWITSVLVVVFVVWLSISSTVEPIKKISTVSPSLAYHMIRLYPQVFLLLQPFSLFLLMSLYLFTETFVTEKSQGRIEVLMTSPLRVKEIWLGKSLAIFALVYPFVLVTELVYLGMWRHTWGGQIASRSVMPGNSTFVVGLVGGPLMALEVVGGLGLVALLVNNVNGVQLAAFFVAFGATFGGSYILGSVQKKMVGQSTDLITWTVVLVVLVISVLLAFALLAWSRYWLEKDKIVRSFR